MRDSSSFFHRPLICCAVKQEVLGLRKLARAGQAEVLLTGMGVKNAEASLDKRLSAGPEPDLVLSCGFAGGLHPKWKVGSVLFDCQEQSELEIRLVEAGAHRAKFHCSNRVIVQAWEKQEVWRATGADAVEMESAALSRLCVGRKISFGAVRVVSDDGEQDLPLDFSLFTDAQQRIQYGKLMGHLLAHPSKIGLLVRFQKEIKAAAMALGGVMERVFGG